MGEQNKTMDIILKVIFWLTIILFLSIIICSIIKARRLDIPIVISWKFDGGKMTEGAFTSDQLTKLNFVLTATDDKGNSSSIEGIQPLDVATINKPLGQLTFKDLELMTKKAMGRMNFDFYKMALVTNLLDQRS